MPDDPLASPAAQPGLPALGLPDNGTHAGLAGGKPPIMDQPFDADSLYALREAVAAHAAQAGLSEGRVMDLVLAVHELAANAVRHGAGRGRLRVWVADDALRCEVTDGGAPADGAPADGAPADGAPANGDGGGADGPPAGSARPGSAAARQEPGGATGPWPVEHGHGLWLVRQVADHATLDSGPDGTVAAVSFALGQSGPPAPFGIDQRVEGGCAVVTVTGQLDLVTAGRFDAVVTGLTAAAEAPRLVVDLSGLTMWDSSGLAALLSAQHRIGTAPGARMVLAALPDPLARRLREIGLAGRFTLAGSATEAVRLLARPAAPPAAGRAHASEPSGESGPG